MPHDTGTFLNLATLFTSLHICLVLDPHMPGADLYHHY